MDAIFKRGLSVVGSRVAGLWRAVITDYWEAWVSAIPIGGGLVASYFYFPAVGTVLGLLFYIPVQFFWRSCMQPNLRIKDTQSGNELPMIDPYRDSSGRDRIWGSRVIVENTGRSAAKNCKGYIVYEGSKKRVCWTVPKEQPNATINVEDEEGLEFYGFWKDMEKKNVVTIAPTEEGWPDSPRNCRKLGAVRECEVLVTADNAKPVGARIEIDRDKKEIRITSLAEGPRPTGKL